MNINEIKWTEELLKKLIDWCHGSNEPAEILIDKFINFTFPPKTYTEEEVKEREEAAWNAARDMSEGSYGYGRSYLEINDWRNQKSKP